MTSSGQIPKSIEKAILLNRQKDNKTTNPTNKDFEKMDDFYKNLKFVNGKFIEVEQKQNTSDRTANQKISNEQNEDTVQKPEMLKQEELRFWEIADDQILDNFLGDLLYGVLIHLPDKEWATLPPGYRPLIKVLDFESHCSNDGWNAVFDAEIKELEETIYSYQFIGLHDEANALKAVIDKYKQLVSNGEKKFGEECYHALRKAYRSVPNSTSNEEDRFLLIFKFVRSHPEYFQN